MNPATKSNTVTEGSDFVFSCEYTKNSNIKWQRFHEINGTEIMYTILDNLITDKSTDQDRIEEYRIQNVSIADSGRYQCEVVDNSNKKVTEWRVLTVRERNAPEFEKVKDFFTFNTNEKGNIRLTVMGTPSPNITCYKDNKEIIFCSGKDIDSADLNTQGATPLACDRDRYGLNGVPELIIESISFVRDDGNYTCVATNPVGKDVVSFYVDVTVPPSISRGNSEYFTARHNTEGEIKCMIRWSNPRPNITWDQQIVNNNNEPVSNNWTPSQYKSSFKKGKNKGQYESVLKIPATAKQASMLFRCFAQNIHGNDSRMFRFLRFGDDPFNVFPSGDVILNENEDFMVICRVDVSIRDNIAFYKENPRREVINNERTNITISRNPQYRNVTMKIRNININDSGTYRCSEKNALSNERAVVTLNVRGIYPPVIYQMKDSTVNKDKDKDAELICNVSGNPRPTVTWSRNDEEIGRVIITNCKTQVPNYYLKNDGTTLIICGVDISHSGNYTCFAKNQLGNVTATVYLNVTGKPKIDEPSTLIDESLFPNEKKTFSCVASGNPTPWVQWISLDSDVKLTAIAKKEIVMTVEKMNKSYIGNYSCKAWNSFGITEKRLLSLRLRPQDPTPTIQNDDGTSPGTIAGIVIGVSIVIILIIIIVLYRKQKQKLSFYKHQYFLRTGNYSIDPSITLNEQSMNLPYDSDWEFPFERLVMGDRLGAGAFGEVYKAEAMGILALNPRDKSSIAGKRRSKIRRTLRASQRPKKKDHLQPNSTNAIVAVKTVKAHATESEIRDLAEELKLMIHIGENKNIVNLLGACTKGRQLYVILEFCPHGNLLTFLRSKRSFYESTWEKKIYDPEKEFTLIDIVGAAFQIAKGMEFLASRKLIHRDLAARNILLAEEYVMKISDFGLARDIYKSDVYVKTSSGMLPVKWMAVESLFDRVYTHQSDVWSFGVLLWEMMTLGGTPYPDLPPEQLLDFLNQEKRMPQPNKCPLEIYTIMRDCWQEQPQNRPTFSNLVEHFGRILERHMEKTNPYLHIEASAEEIEAAREKDELLKKKSDYYLQPLLISNKLHGYDSNAPLPTPPTDAYTASTVPLPEVAVEPSTQKLKDAGSYERLADDASPRKGVSYKNEDAIRLENMTATNHNDTKDVQQPEKIESIV
ncbi:vascular endothelial growth factor receptor 2-like isoform X2 [Xenia sp. Carnegie-2017]|uniref:vascular endothelial growth factor receptor 2-like isoform X2 n=1 Tax=Xenia sp. Carnegie-2017 TaxID=2897299 RepID=UPI001F036ED7|nr:vascular endothelial growth factor receptor 2-like isoform X2 [Xenia sp. Carnegie-2017]